MNSRFLSIIIALTFVASSRALCASSVVPIFAVKLLVQIPNSSSKTPSSVEVRPLWEVASLAPNQQQKLGLRTKTIGEPLQAFMDAFWWTSTPASSEDIFAKYPNLAELSVSGSCSASPTDGKYASPFNSQVRAILRNTVGNIASSAGNSSLLLRCRLARTAVLGYSDAARLGYINAKGIDAIDIKFGSGDVDAEKIAQEWISWRLSQMGSLVSSLSATYKTKKPKGQLAVMGSADWLYMTNGQKNRTLEDWPTWAASGAIDEIVLEGDWTVPQGRADFAASKAALADINAKLQAAAKTKRTPIKLTVLIPLRDASGRALDPLSQMLTLQGQGVKSIMLQVSDASDLPRANEFISQTLPSIESVLQ